MIKFSNISKEYHVGTQFVKALNQVNFEIEPHQLTVILGPSGSGKSTLLNILGGMDRPTKGDISFNDQQVNKLNDHDLTSYRRKVVGFVFQFYNLIPSLTALENVAIGGEMQRVSIARALAKKPKLLLCDEPTGALDSTTSMKILGILQNIANTTDTAVVMVTHNPEFERYGNRIIRLKDGEIESINDNEQPLLVGETG